MHHHHATVSPATQDTHTGFVAFPTILFFLALLLGYLGLACLYVQGYLAGWACGLLGAALAYGMFTVVHEASHGNIAGGHGRFQMLERLLGWAAASFLFFPYPAFIVIHLQHHAHTDVQQHRHHFCTS